LLARTLLKLNAVDLGVRLENTLTFEVPADHEGQSAAEIVALQHEIQRRIEALPGVQAVGVGLSVPLRRNFVMLEIMAEIGRASCRERVERWGGGGSAAERRG